MDSAETEETSIYLTYLNGTGFCFNVDDYMKIRTECRIVGSLVGTCNVRGWTPDINGLPAEFNNYETRLLVEKGYVRLVAKNTLKEMPSSKQREEYQAFKEKRIEDQETMLKTEKLKDSQNNIEKIIAGKRKKLLKAGVEEKDINLTPTSVLQEIAESITFDPRNALLDIPYEHPFPHEGTAVSLAGDTSLKYQVFRDLWEKGMYVTSGEAFGADFIAYPGDPMMFHASHIVIVMNDCNISTLELITKGRLAVTVNKKCTFAYQSKESCSCNSEEGTSSSCSNKINIKYQTLSWEGNINDAKRS